MIDHYDVIVVGAGVTGSVAALMFANRELQTAILDINLPVEPSTEHSIRVASINPASESILKKLDIWPTIEKYRVSPFNRIDVWEDNANQKLSFLAESIGATRLGCIVENDILSFAAWSKFESSPNATTLQPDMISSIAACAQGKRITMKSGKAYSCRLLVGADGQNSTIRELSNINVERFDYRQMAIVSQVRTDKLPGTIARQKFLPEGPLAFLPLGNNQSSIVWSVGLDKCETVLAMTDSEFCRYLADSFDNQLGDVLECGKRVCFPLVRRHANRYIGDSSALIGDACHTVHPLAGLGANQGIGDAVTLIAKTFPTNENIFRPTYRNLRKYERERRALNQKTLSTMDLFYFGFGSSNQILKSLRTSSLAIVNRSNFLKSFFIENATQLDASLEHD